MATCKCGRELEPGEERCPACRSKKSHGAKKVIKIAIAVGGVLLMVLTRGRFRPRV